MKQCHRKQALKRSHRLFACKSAAGFLRIWDLTHLYSCGKVAEARLLCLQLGLPRGRTLLLRGQGAVKVRVQPAACLSHLRPLSLRNG